MNGIQIFKSEQFGEIRTAGTAEKPMFCLRDVCKVLELEQVSRVKSRLNQDGVTSIKVIDRLGRNQTADFINESNLYKVIMRSDKPQAEPFQDWVCGEVLPEIRKNGGYIAADRLSDEEIMARAFGIAQRTIERKDRVIEEKNQVIERKDRVIEEKNQVIEQRDIRIAELEGENIQVIAENQELRNDKSYLDLIMRSNALLTISQIAQDYGMSGKAMNKQLADMRIQYSLNGQWILFARYKNCGYVSSRSIEIVRANGKKDWVLHTEWTQSGRKFLYEELKKVGILPMLERN